MYRKETELKTIFLFLIIFFSTFLIFPILGMVMESIRITNTFGLENFIQVINNKDFITIFRNSFFVSLVSSIITIILAFFLALSIHYTNIPKFFKNIIYILSIFPMLLPTMTYGFVIIYSFGKQGAITKLIGRQLFEIYGFNGLVIGYVIYTLPTAFLLICNTLNYVDKKFITVSKLMGDNCFKTLFIAVIRPSIVSLGAAFIQSFFLSFTDYGIPSAIGGKYDVLSTLLYNTMLGSVPNFGQGAVIAIMMAIPSIFSIALLSFLNHYNFRYDKLSNESIGKNKFRDIIFGIFSLTLIFIIFAIFLVLFIVPFTKMWPYNLNFTLENVFHFFHNSQLSYIYTNSLIVALFTGIIGTLLAYGGSLITERSKLPKKIVRVIDWFALVINSIPGMVLGIAFLIAFSGTKLQNTIILLVTCNIIHFYSTPYLMMKNSLSKINSSWETTAMLMGDSWIKTIVRVITPNVKNTILEVFEYYFINSMVTISAIIFLSGARTMTLTTKIKELQYMAKFDEIFIYSILILITNLALKSLIKLVSHRISEQRRT